MEPRLYRSRNDRMIAGVCGGIAEYYGWDPVLVRLGAVVLGLVTSGAMLVAYVVLAIVVPEAPAEGYPQGSTVPPYQQHRHYHAGTSAYSAPQPPSSASAPVPPAAPDASPAAPISEEPPMAPEEGMGPGDVPEPGEYDEPVASEPTAPLPPTAGRQWADTAPTAPYPPASDYPGRHHRRSGGLVGGVVLIVIGALLLANQVLGIDIDRLWPLVLIAIGLAIVFGRSRRDY